MSSAYNKYGVANYTAAHRLAFREDDVFVKVWQPLGGIDGVTSRVSRTTFAQSARSYPRRYPASPRKQAVISSHGGPFKDVTKSEIENITKRVCKPTSSCKEKRCGELPPPPPPVSPRHSSKLTRQQLDAMSSRLHTGGGGAKKTDPRETRVDGRSGRDTGTPKGSDKPTRRSARKTERSEAEEIKDQRRKEDGQTEPVLDAGDIQSDKTSFQERDSDGVSLHGENDENDLNEQGRRSASVMSEQSTTSTRTSRPNSAASASTFRSSSPDRSEVGTDDKLADDEGDIWSSREDIKTARSQDSAKYSKTRVKSKSPRRRRAREIEPDSDSDSDDDQRLSSRVSVASQTSIKSKTSNGMPLLREDVCQEKDEINGNGTEVEVQHERRYSSGSLSSGSTIKAELQKIQGNDSGPEGAEFFSSSEDGKHKEIARSNQPSRISVSSKRSVASRKSKSDSVQENETKLSKGRESKTSMRENAEDKRYSVSSQNSENGNVVSRRVSDACTVSSANSVDRKPSGGKQQISPVERRTSTRSSVSASRASLQSTKSTGDRKNGNRSGSVSSAKREDSKNYASDRSESQASLRSITSLNSEARSAKFSSAQAQEARAGLLKVILDQDKKNTGTSLSSLSTDYQSDYDYDNYIEQKSARSKSSIEERTPRSQRTPRLHARKNSGSSLNMDRHNGNESKS